MPDDKRKPPEIPEGPPPLPFKLQVRTLKSARRSFSRVLRAWSAGEVETDAAKTTAWLLNGLLGFFKESAATDLADRMAVIERKLKKLEALDGNSKGYPRIERS